VDRKTRLDRAFSLAIPDRPPILGGWLAAPDHIQSLTGCSEDEYWADPVRWGLEAEHVLGSDGAVTVFVPRQRGGYRCVDERVLEDRAAHTLESMAAEIEARPDPVHVRDSFEAEAAYAQFQDDFVARQDRCGDLVWCPADWALNPLALPYHRYGHENALLFPVLYPELHLKLLRLTAELGRQHAALRARAILEGYHPRAILFGEDLCGQQGPMISPEYLRQAYFPLLEYAIEPLLEVGAKLVWHCDGNVRPILADLLACGVGGLQGFQRECGIDLEWIADLRTSAGEPLVIFGPLEVTTTLPFGTTEDVRLEVRRAMALSRGKASLVFFTSNTINPDVPLENIRAYWDEVLASRW
jgi:hypothetical protein